MQLLALLLMLMASGKNSDFKQIEPIINSLGGEAADAFKQAEELSGVISAVQSLAGTPKGGEFSKHSEGFGGSVDGYPLAPIASIADEKITHCLSRYIALGE